MIDAAREIRVLEIDPLNELMAGFGEPAGESFRVFIAHGPRIRAAPELRLQMKTARSRGRDRAAEGLSIGGR
jgi:hypothetical protein